MPTRLGQLNAPSLIDFLERAAAAHPDAVFAHFFGLSERSTLTVGELSDRSRRFGQVLRTRGLKTGEIVAVIHETGPNLLAGFLGAIAAGMIPTIMAPPSTKQPRAIYWSSHAALYSRIQPRVILASPTVARAYQTGLPQFADRVLVLSDALLGSSSPAAPTPTGGDTVAFLQHSSGTTAHKKGVMLSHRQVIDHVNSYADVIGLRAGDAIASWLPLYHDMGLIACFILPLVRQCPVAMVDPFDWLVKPLMIVEAIERCSARYCWLPDFAFRHLAAAIRTTHSFDLSEVRAFINCSEPCKPTSHRAFLTGVDRFGIDARHVQACYAMAENVFAVTQTPPSTPPTVITVAANSLAEGQVVVLTPGSGSELMSCGCPLPGVGLRIVDRGRQTLREGHVGEIAITSPTLFSEYHGQPEKTEQVLIDGEYFTGDLGFIVNAELYVVGRTDDVIIVYGRNFVAHELEAIANQVAGVKAGRVAALGVTPWPDAAQELALVYELLDGFDSEAVSHAIRDALQGAAGIVPGYLLRRPGGSLIKTTSGKISRSLNKAIIEREIRTAHRSSR
jgi:fatty-acyl-CoA synthase